MLLEYAAFGGLFLALLIVAFAKRTAAPGAQAAEPPIPLGSVGFGDGQ